MLVLSTHEWSEVLFSVGIGCPPNTAEYLKIYSDLASVEAFTPVLSAAMGF